MSIKLSLFKCFIIFIFGFLLGNAIKNVYEASTFQSYSWKEPPIIINCYKDMPEKVILEAIDYWAVRGHEFGFHEMNPSEDLCKSGDYLEGFIIIKKDFFIKDPTTLATTYRYTSFGSIKGAIIKMRPRSHKLDLLLTHELGHSLGFGHKETRGHIMHPIYDEMGEDFY